MSNIFEIIKPNKLDVEIKGKFWKVHISPKIEDFEIVKKTVHKIATECGVTYKRVVDRDAMYLLSSVGVPASQIGKLITLYPSTVSIAKNLLNRLYDELKHYDGIEVISDRPYRDSKVIWYRYGTHTPLDTEKEERKPYFVLPENITDPFVSEDQFLTGSIIQKQYSFIKILRRKGEGNIYLAKNKMDEQVVIKEVRKNVYISPNIKKTAQKEFEFQFISRANNNKNLNIPKAIEKIEEKYSIFYVYAYVQGNSLENFPALVRFMESTSKDKSEILKNIIFQLLNSIRELSFLGIDKLDIHPGNFIISNNKLFWIDLDYCESQTPLFQTRGFWMSQFSNETANIQNLRRLGLLILYLLGDINFFVCQSNNLDRGYYLSLQKSLKEKINLNICKVAIYLLDNINPQIEEALTILEEKEVREVKSAINNYLKDHFLTEKPLDYKKLDSLHTGLKGIGRLVAENVTPELYSEIKTEIRNRISKFEKRTLVKRLGKGNVYSPYIDEGTSGLIWGMLQNTKQWEFEECLEILDALCFDDAKSPGLVSGILGITYVLLLVYERHPNLEYLRFIENQLLSAINYVEIHNGFMQFRKFNTETIDESILNGFRGFEAVYNFYLEIYRRKEINETVSAQA
jgi:putative uncharacterized protein ORF00050